MIAAISLYIPFRYTNSSTAGDLTSILFFGIMASGYTLNWCLKILKKTVAISVMVAVGIGFLLMSITSNVFIVVASIDSIGNVVAAPLIDLIAKIFHTSTSANPLIAFKICMYLSFAGLIVVIIRKIIVAGKNYEEHHGVSGGTAHVGSVQPIAVGAGAQTTVTAPKASATGTVANVPPRFRPVC